MLPLVNNTVYIIQRRLFWWIRPWNKTGFIILKVQSLDRRGLVWHTKKVATEHCLILSLINYAGPWFIISLNNNPGPCCILSLNNYAGPCFILFIINYCMRDLVSFYPQLIYAWPCCILSLINLCLTWFHSIP